MGKGLYKTLLTFENYTMKEYKPEVKKDGGVTAEKAKPKTQHHQQ